jgi:hypothetical protein
MAGITSPFDFVK